MSAALALHVRGSRAGRRSGSLLFQAASPAFPLPAALINRCARIGLDLGLTFGAGRDLITAIVLALTLA